MSRLLAAREMCRSFEIFLRITFRALQLYTRIPILEFSLKKNDNTKTISWDMILGPGVGQLFKFPPIASL